MSTREAAAAEHGAGSSTTKVAFIGLGAMGSRMAGRLAQTEGIELSVFDLVPERLQAFDGMARLASSVADAADGADTIFSVVPADQHTRAVVDALLPAAKPGQTYVDFSTIGPATIEAVEEQLADRGVVTISAGMTKSIEGATHGTLSLFVGGPSAFPDNLQPAFDALAGDVMFVGSVGAAKALKLVNNMVVATLDIAITEALAMGEQFGLSFESLTDAMKDGGADNWPLHNHIIAHVLPDNLGPGFFSTRFLIKDMKLYIRFATERRVPALFAGLANAEYRGTCAHGMGDHYHMIVIRWLEQTAGFGKRDRSALPEGVDEADARRTLVDAVAAVQALVSAEAIKILGRMGVQPADAAFYLESGSAGNDSLRALVRCLEHGEKAVALPELLTRLEASIDLASAGDLPGTCFEVARHVVLGHMDRYGAESALWDTAIGQ